jgi:hypothetical protein
MTTLLEKGPGKTTRTGRLVGRHFLEKAPVKTENYLIVTLSSDFPGYYVHLVGQYFRQ